MLKPQGLDPKGADMIRTLALMYEKPIGAWTVTVFLIGAWAVLFKTLYVATAANSRLTADFLNLAGFWTQPGPAARERVVRAFCVIYPLLAFGLYVAFREPKGLVKVGGYAQGLMLPLIAGATLYLSRRDGDRRVAPSFLAEALAWFAFFAITAVALFSLRDLIRGPTSDGGRAGPLADPPRPVASRPWPLRPGPATTRAARRPHARGGPGESVISAHPAVADWRSSPSC